MDYALFILTCAALFLRPGEISADLQGFEFYLYSILACTVAATPKLLKLFSTRLDRSPLILCVLFMLVLAFLAPLTHGDFEHCLDSSFMFFKSVLFFVLFVALVDTPARLRSTLAWICFFVFVLTLITVLQFHEVLKLKNLRAAATEQADGQHGETETFQRLQSSGLFQDPNELCVIMACMVPIALYCFFYDRMAMRKALWLSCLGLFVYAILLTRSRGGFVALVAALGICAWARYGAKRTALLGVAGLPLLLVFFGGRQTDLSTSAGTGQSRIQLWSDWLEQFRYSPLFGGGATIGANLDAFLAAKGMGHLAHNSYIQAFADLGLPGGCLFLGQFALAWVLIRRLRQAKISIIDPQQQQLGPFVLAMLTAYIVGMMTLSVNYVAPTLLMLAIACSFERCSPTYPPLKPIAFDKDLALRFLALGLAFLVCIHLFVRMFVSWG